MTFACFQNPDPLLEDRESVKSLKVVLEDNVDGVYGSDFEGESVLYSCTHRHTQTHTISQTVDNQ